MSTTENTATEEGCQMAAPEKEHEWLQQFVGQWESEGEVVMGPGAPTTKLQGTESTCMIGNLWVVGQIESGLADMAYEQLFTIGYDPTQKKYIGTVVDSMSSHFWRYVGSVDASGKKLSMETEGPGPDGSTCRMRDSTEFKSSDHKVFTSEMLGENGEWFTFMTINARRKN